MQCNELQHKLDEANRTLGDFDAAKKKLAVENSELQRQLEEAESQLSQLNKLRTSLQTQLDEAKRTADEEARVSLFTHISSKCEFLSRKLLKEGGTTNRPHFIGLRDL